MRQQLRLKEPVGFCQGNILQAACTPTNNAWANCRQTLALPISNRRESNVMMREGWTASRAQPAYSCRDFGPFVCNAMHPHNHMHTGGPHSMLRKVSPQRVGNCER